jgi:hypothetical protein
LTDDLCPRCGWVLGAGVAACPACGERLAGRSSGYETAFIPEATVAAAGEGATAPSAGTTLLPAELAAGGPKDLQLKLKALLIRRGGSASGQRLDVASPTSTVGRQGADISIDDPTLSSLHFMIEERGHEFFLRDLGSTNGTFLNGHLVRSAPLKSGDEVRAGESVFHFSVLQVIPCD